MKENVSKGVDMSDIIESFECNVMIRIHEDTTMQIGKETHNISLNNNDLNIRLRLIPDENSSNEESTIVDDTADDKDSSKSLQFYRSASSMAPKNVSSGWLQCKNIQKKKKRNVWVNDVVMAKLRGHSAWPAIVLEILPKNKAKVEFFGANLNEKFGFVNISEVTLFKGSTDVLLLILKKNIKKFSKAVKEAEMVCGVSEEHSLLKHAVKALQWKFTLNLFKHVCLYLTNTYNIIILYDSKENATNYVMK